ncbi:MAG: trypsin [Planctomycetota bacterium]|nr:MAG: trypsin [Planctomycetota bacterium]
MLRLPVALFIPLLAACASLSAQQDSVSAVFDEVQQAVVTLHTASSKLIPDGSGRTATVNGMGSGALIKADGTILTAAHVVQTASALIVEFSDGHKQEARVISSVPGADIAMVRLIGPVPEGVKPLALADMNGVRVGQQVLVIGAPLGQTHSLSVGHVSARRNKEAFLPMDHQIEFIQTDAAINQGNSGGPMIDMNGDVVGVVSHIMSQSGGSEGLGYAVSVGVVQAMLLDGPGFWSGAEMVPVGGVLAQAINMPEGMRGLLIQSVSANSPAAEMGLRAGTVTAVVEGQPIVLGGDVVLKVQGLPVDSPGFFSEVRKLVAFKDGSLLTVTVLRAGEKVELSHRIVMPRG